MMVTSLARTRYCQLFQADKRAHTKKKPVLKHFRLAWRRCSISVSLNRPKFTFGFMAWPVLKQSKARFGYDMGRLFLIARRVLALTVISD